MLATTYTAGLVINTAAITYKLHRRAPDADVFLLALGALAISTFWPVYRLFQVAAFFGGGKK